MVGMGIKETNFMYHWIDDKKFLSKMRSLCSDVVNRLVQKINQEDYLKVAMQMVGSGARNIETQNEKESIDLDYNIYIKKINGDINDGRKIKEYIRKKFNEVLKEINWGDCQDSTSALTTEKRYFTQGNKTEFSIDLGIVYEDGKSWYRLIHKKTGNTNKDTWIWNEGPQSKGLVKKIEWLKSDNYWTEVRETYLNKKNMYLKRREKNHPSFNCYIETVNEVYSKHH